MRRDMDRVIIDTKRWKDSTRRRRLRKREKNDPAYWIATKGKMRPPSWSWHTYLGDRLAPLQRFLLSRCGQHWNDIMSEILDVIDCRNIKGHHLLEHVSDFVMMPNDPYRWIYSGMRGFVVDYDGILRFYG